MSKLILVYFEGCPNAAKLRDNLIKAGYEFNSVRQDDLIADDPLRHFSSPSILRGGDVIFGTKVQGGGCSIGVPSVEELKHLLTAARSKG